MTKASFFLLIGALVICGRVQCSEDVSLTQGTNESWNLDWEGASGRTYFLKFSDDLINWSYFPTIEPGTGQPLGYGFTATSPRFFVQLAFSDIFTSDPFNADFDDDGLSNWNELTVSLTDPLDEDSDNDGINDGLEISNGLNPNDPTDAGADFDLDGLSNAWELANDLDPNDPSDADSIGPDDLGFGEPIFYPEFSFRNDYPSDLYHQDSFLGWKADIGEYIEVWDEGDGNPYIELQAHWGSHGVQQEFHLLPGARLNFILRYKGRYDDPLYENAFTMKVVGASEMLVNGNPVTEVANKRESSFMESDAWEQWVEWQYTFVTIAAPDEATTPTKITLSLSPKITSKYGEEITYGAFVDLLPVEVRDVNGLGIEDDVVIMPWDKTKEIRDMNIAWIDPHTSIQNPAPRMPQLKFKIPNISEVVTLEAKLLVVYERPYAGIQAEDTVMIPIDGSFKTVDNGEWKIYEDYEELSFFGGDAILIYKINDGTEQKIHFAIGGKNPDDDKCKDYTQSHQNAPWYAYAIEKHESQAYNAGFYNQFWERSGNSSPINGGVNYEFTKGDPLKVLSVGETGVGGTGLAQVTGAGGNKSIPASRDVFWNWQKNVDAFLVILADKIQIADTFMNDQAPRSASNPMPNGQRPQTIYHTGANVPVPSRTQAGVTFGDNQGEEKPEDAVAIKAYNGATAHWCSWQGPSNNSWQWNYGQNNYVVKVCEQK